MLYIKNFNWTLVAMVFCASLVKCNGTKQSNSSNSSGYSKEELEQYNQTLAKKEAEQLKAFISKSDWDAKRSGTGLYYWNYLEGTGASPVPGNTVKVNLTITLLNGDTAYSHVRYGSEDFLVDRTNKESGLNEGVQYMREGGKAKLLLPSHLGHGMVGDMDKIPPRSALIFDVELLEVR